MALERQTLPIRLGGMDSKTDNLWAVPGDFIDIRNVIYDNWPKIRKRNGYRRLMKQDAGALASVFKSQVLMGTGQDAWAYSASGDAVNVGALPSISVSTQAAARDIYTKQTPDVAVHPSGITVVTFESVEGGSPVARYSVLDTATQQFLVRGQAIGANAERPRCSILGGYVVIIYFDSVLNSVRFIGIPATSPGTPTDPADIVVSTAAGIFDAALVGGQHGRLFVLAQSGTTPTLLYITTGLAVSSGLAVTTATTMTAAAVFAGADESGTQEVWAVWQAGTTVSATVWRTDLYSTPILAATTVTALAGDTMPAITGAVAEDGGDATIYFQTNVAPLDAGVSTATVSRAGAVGAATVLSRAVTLASKPYVVDGLMYAQVFYPSGVQPTYFIYRGRTPVGRLASGLAGAIVTTDRNGLPGAALVTPTQVRFAYLQADTVEAFSGTVLTQHGVQAGSLEFSSLQGEVELSDNLHISGAMLSMFDGSAVCEHGFHLYPEIADPVESTTGGLMAAGQYQYAAVYEWMDAQGLIHQSAPSLVGTATIASGSTGSVTVTVSTLRVTSKPTPVSVVLYRTLVNQGVFYRLGTISDPTVNDETVDSVSFVDGQADSAITGNSLLYSNPTNPGAEVANLPCPATNYVWRYRNRVCFIPAESPFQWGYSKAFVPGVPIEFNPQQFYQAVAQDGGPLTCGIEMDDKNVLFTRTRIYVVAGDGPAPNGANVDYGSSPQAIPSDVGCVDPRSLVLTPAGIIFKSAKGIYLLTRGLALSYIGANVESWNDANITGSAVIPNSRRVIFVTDRRIALVYDYYVQKWCVWGNHDAADVTIFGGLLCYLRPDGRLLLETPGLYSDDGGPVLISWVTGWLSFAGLAAFQRVWRFAILGDYRSPHKLTVSVAVNNNPIPVQTDTVAAAAILTPGVTGDTLLADVENPGDGVFPSYEWVVKLKRQSCSSMQVTVKETQEDGVQGEGLSVSAMTFLAGVKAGITKAPAKRAMG
jgi:hypothetical protein